MAVCRRCCLRCRRCSRWRDRSQRRRDRHGRERGHGARRRSVRQCRRRLDREQASADGERRAYSRGIAAMPLNLALFGARGRRTAFPGALVAQTPEPVANDLGAPLGGDNRDAHERNELHQVGGAVDMALPESLCLLDTVSSTPLSGNSQSAHPGACHQCSCSGPPNMVRT